LASRLNFDFGLSLNIRPWPQTSGLGLEAETALRPNIWCRLANISTYATQWSRPNIRQCLQWFNWPTW